MSRVLWQRERGLGKRKVKSETNGKGTSGHSSEGDREIYLLYKEKGGLETRHKKKVMRSDHTQ